MIKSSINFYCYSSMWFHFFQSNKSHPFDQIELFFNKRNRTDNPCMHDWLVKHSLQKAILIFRINQSIKYNNNKKFKFPFAFNHVIRYVWALSRRGFNFMHHRISLARPFAHQSDRGKKPKQWTKKKIKNGTALWQSIEKKKCC